MKGGGRLAVDKLSSEAEFSVHGLLASHNSVGQSGIGDRLVGDGSPMDSRHVDFSFTPIASCMSSLRTGVGREDRSGDGDSKHQSVCHT